MINKYGKAQRRNKLSMNPLFRDNPYFIFRISFQSYFLCRSVYICVQTPFSHAVFKLML